MQAAESISITICGDGGCGKSSITLRLVRGQWTHDYDPTIEDSYSTTRNISGRPYLLSLTDTAGQEEYRSLFAATSLTHADAFLLVYDITSPPSLPALQHFHDMIAAESEARQQQRRPQPQRRRGRGGGGGSGDNPASEPAEPVIMVVGNKCDLQSQRQISSSEGLAWARSRGAGFMETSARECVNVEETFEVLIRKVTEARRAKANPTPKASSPAKERVGKSSAPAAYGMRLRGQVGENFAPIPPDSPTLAEKQEGDRYGSVDLVDRPGGKVRRGGKWWTRLRCW